MTDAGKRPLKVGLFLPQLETFYQGGTARWSDIEAIARAAEGVGFDSLWLADHLLYRFPEVGTFGIWECWSLMAAVAAVTEHVELGTMVTVTPWRNPALFAKMVDTVEEISGGRVILGLGAGSHQPEFPAFGYDSWDHKVSRFEEEIQIIRTLLREGRIDFEGKYHTLRDCELRLRGPRPGGPPIMVGAVGPRMLRILATYADEWNIPWRHNVADIVTETARVDAACRAVGRDPATLRRSACLQINLPTFAETPMADMQRASRAQALTGDPAELAAKLRAYADAGIAHAQLWLAPGDVAAVEWFGQVLEELDRG